jgi:hypothetical protein
VIDMVNAIESVDPTTRIATYKNPELRGAVSAVLRSRRDLDASTLGYWLRNKKDRMVNDMQLKNEPGMDTKWWVAIGDQERGPEF